VQHTYELGWAPIDESVGAVGGNKLDAALPKLGEPDLMRHEVTRKPVGGFNDPPGTAAGGWADRTQGISHFAEPFGGFPGVVSEELCERI
jgi:hypothetical protein